MDKKNIKLEALKKKLTELFQLDKTDLDFGIYRILNQKRKDVEHFIESDLPEIVNEELSKYDSGKNVELQSELDNAIKNAKELGGVDPESTDKVKDLRTQLKESISKDDIEAEVYSSLTDFFSRYYDEGDFISQRRYKDGVYAIPYEGEEVKLHWANADQYYIKTSEDFANFSFYIDEAQTKRVSFRIAKAETEKDNNKEADSKKRRFALVSDAPVELVDDTLVIRFTYEASSSKQESLNQQAEEQVKQLLPQEFSALFAKAPTEKDKNRTVFGKWLGHYTSKNTFDYFIHKDLRGFLSRELDFYIKNELLRIDDLDAFAETTNSRLVSKIKVFKHIAETVIRFHAQLEELQKKLWEKMKFVVESDYLITLDNIDNEYFEKIIENNEQLNEWKSLGYIDTNTPVDADFLRNHLSLQLNTRFFRDIKFLLLAKIENLDEKINGILINGDNFHALNILRNKFKGEVDACYIDPPYNTNATEIIYKNGYKQSSWLSLMNDRLVASSPLLSNLGLITVTIDDYEQSKLTELMSGIYGQDNQLGIVAIRINPKGRMTARKTSLVHEYAVIYGASDKATVKKLPVDPSEKTHNYKQDDDGTWFLPVNLRKQGVDSEAKRSDGTYFDRYYPIYINPISGEVSTKIEYDIKVLPIDMSGQERIWRRGADVIDTMYATGDIWASNTSNGWQIYYKFRGGLDGKMVQSMWTDSKYSASDHGTRILDSMLGIREQFSYPKSPYAVEDSILAMSSKKDAQILDYFAGSGTTGHSVIELNRKDGGSRKYILVEMGSYFATVTKPRIQKAIYSNSWKNGLPQDDGKSGVSQIVKYLKLESYEDALNNLKFAQQTDAQRSFLENDKALERNYRINYMLDFESQDSRSLLDVKQFEDPFNYEMLIQDDSNRLVPTNVDLVETFNYLIGLNVDHIEQKKGFIVVHGKQNDGTRTLIIWRNVNENPNEKLNEFLEKSAYNPRDGEFDVIYVNGDNNVENLQTADDAWKVRLIEEEFHKRMFN